MHHRIRDHTDSIFPRLIYDESEITAGVQIRPGRHYGFFTDTSVCIGCKSCEVACKEWNQLPVDNYGLTAMSYDNTRALGAATWRHVVFAERLDADAGPEPTLMPPFQSGWRMMSDVCKHCYRAGCLEACPTGSLFRTEFGSVVVQQDICNGCGYCVASCPFGVVELSHHDGKAHKCTLCYDRLKVGLEPACAKACPTDSITFGEVDVLLDRAEARVRELHGLGVRNAYLYGSPGSPGATGEIGGLNCFFLLLDRPEVYNLPVAPLLPPGRTGTGLLRGILTMAGLGLVAAVVYFSERRSELRNGL
jgi:formate dehydrogenase iron-sulfur subunit